MFYYLLLSTIFIISYFDNILLFIIIHDCYNFIIKYIFLLIMTIKLYIKVIKLKKNASIQIKMTKKKRNFIDCLIISKCPRVEISKHKIDNIKRNCQFVLQFYI